MPGSLGKRSTCEDNIPTLFGTVNLRKLQCPAVRAVVRGCTMGQESLAVISGILDNCIRQACDDPEIISKEPGRYFTRNRKFNSFSLVKYLITISAGSLNQSLFDYCEDNCISADKRPSKQAVIKARKHLGENAFKFIMSQFNNECREYDSRTYKGFRLFAIDGSSFNVARDEKAKSYMEKQDFNQLHISAFYDILNEVYIDLDIKPKPEYNEPRSACDMVDRNDLPKNSIIICDRGYSSLNLIEHINRAGLYYLIRYKDSHTIKEINELPLEEADIQITREVRTTQTKEDMELFKSGKASWISGKSTKGKRKKRSRWDFEKKCSVKMRVVRVRVDGKIETLVTNLPASMFAAYELKEMYSMRWGVETSFRTLKYHASMNAIHSKSTESVIQEIYANFIFFNLSQRVKLLEEPEQNPQSKWRKAKNCRMVIHACKRYYRKLNRDNTCFSEIIARYTEIVRPGRKPERKKRSSSVVPFCYRFT